MVPGGVEAEGPRRSGGPGDPRRAVTYEDERVDASREHTPGRHY